MSDQHLTADECEDYISRRGDAEELLARSDHLLQCAACRARMVDLLGRQPTADPTQQASEISYEDLVTLLDEQTDSLTRRDLAARVRHSAPARAELADLERFRAEMNALPVHDYALEAITPSSGSSAFFRWALPLAAIISIGIGALWWSITLRQQSSPIVRLRDGSGELKLSANGRSLALRDLPAPLQDAIAQAFMTGTIPLPAEIKELAGTEQTLAGLTNDRGDLRVIEPVATAVRDGKPRFLWSPLAGASRYRINILEERSGNVVVTEELPGDRTDWTPPEALRAGERYEWEVQALDADGVLAKSPAPPEPEARFQVLTEAKRAELEEEERLARGSHLILGMANARAGLRHEAVREFEALSEQNPAAELPRKLLEQLQAQRSAQP